ncbi:putative serine incorporator/TMS membrane protein [Helianthus annuus]|nr:putative serine incorporator/TMS membrane protein [Helianthus annuus]
MKQIHAGFLTPGFMGLYVVFLCWSAIRSEPPDDKCLRKSETSRDWLTIIVSLKTFYTYLRGCLV